MTIAYAARDYCPIYYGTEIRCEFTEGLKSETYVVIKVAEEDKWQPVENWVIMPSTLYGYELALWGPAGDDCELQLGIPDELCINYTFSDWFSTMKASDFAVSMIGE